MRCRREFHDAFYRRRPFEVVTKQHTPKFRVPTFDKPLLSDLVCRLIRWITRAITWAMRVIDLLTKSP